MNRGQRFSVAAALAFVALTAPAFATNAGIQQVQSGAATLITFVQWLAGIGAVVLIGLSLWEFFAHRKIGQAIIEFVSGVIIGLVAVNAQAIAQTLGIYGAMLK